MATRISHSPAETEALGAAWADEGAAGWLIGLAGDLGAGKTQLVKGLARGLGCAGRVHSPTFALLAEYSGGRLPLHHLDLYRLDGPSAIAGAGLEEYLLNPPGIVVVEWMDRWLPEAYAAWKAMLAGNGTPGNWPSGPMPPLRLRLAWLEDLGESRRRIVYEDFGA